MNQSRQLEHAALAAHAAGTAWGDYWQEHQDAIREVQPHDRLAYRRLVRRLLALLVSGDVDGMEPVAPAYRRGCWMTTQPSRQTWGRPPSANYDSRSPRG